MNETPSPTESFVILSIVCHKVTEEWPKGFQDFTKRGGLL